jgi:iron complex transport system ATP-binding protein
MSIRACAVTLQRGNHRLLETISLEILRGEVLAVVGPNGAGKSSLLSVLAGDIKPTDGSIEYDQKNIESIDIQQRALTRSVMSQAQGMAFNFSVLEIVKMGWLQGAHDPRAGDFTEITDNIARQCEIFHLLNRSYNSLSGGEQKRVHFARALIQLWLPEGLDENRYLLLDEPLANLDICHEIKMLEIIKQKANSGVGVLIVLHDLNLAAKFADKVALLKRGKLVDFGPPQKVLNQTSLSDVYSIDVTVNQNPFNITYY